MPTILALRRTRCSLVAPWTAPCAMNLFGERGSSTGVAGARQPRRSTFLTWRRSPTTDAGCCGILVVAQRTLRGRRAEAVAEEVLGVSGQVVAVISDEFWWLPGDESAATRNAGHPRCPW